MNGRINFISFIHGETSVVRNFSMKQKQIDFVEYSFINSIVK